MILLRAAKFVIKHPLLVKGASSLVKHRLRPKKGKSKGASLMKNKVRGGAFRLVGLILGIIGAVVSVTAIIFSAVGLHQAHLCKKCDKGANFR